MTIPVTTRTAGTRAPRRFPTSFVVGLAILAALGAVAILAPFLVKSPNAIHLGSTLQSPSASHPFGTDELGRDVLNRVLVATTRDMLIGLLCVIPALLFGSMVGTLAGYFGRGLDGLLMRVTDVVLAFPFTVLVIAIVAALGPGQRNMLIAVVVVTWVSYARLTRSEVQILSQSDYVRAAQVLGYTHRRILVRHILPNAMVQPLTYATNDFVGYILLVSALGYLGLGVQPPSAEWGTMIAGGRSFLAEAPWISIFPGGAIILVGIACILVGNSLTAVLQPGAKR